MCVHLQPQDVSTYQYHCVKSVAFRGSATYLASSSYILTVRADSSRVRRCHLSWKTIWQFPSYYVRTDIQIHFQWQRNFSEIVINQFTLCVSTECTCCWTLPLSGNFVCVLYTAFWFTIVTWIMVTVYRRFRVTYCLPFRSSSFLLSKWTQQFSIQPQCSW